MLDGEDEDSNSDQDAAKPDKLRCKISDDTRRMMDQQFAHPTHTSVGKDVMGLEDMLNDMLRQLGEAVAFDPAAQRVGASQTLHVEGWAV
jgi:hypothetical protein